MWVSASVLYETIVSNSWIWKLIFEELTMEEILRIDCEWGDLLYEFPAETRLTVYRRFDMPNRGELASPWPREDSW